MRRIVFILGAASLLLFTLLAAHAGENDADDYEIPWQSINAGGDAMNSVDYEMIACVGQSAAGYAFSANYHHGIGYAYGLELGEPVDCDCTTWGSVNGDDKINPSDVVLMVNFVYKGDSEALTDHTNCPVAVGDVNCSGGIPNPTDVVLFVNYVYKGITSSFCADPCW